MNNSRSDAFVFFGANDDLACGLQSKYFRFRINPSVVAAFGMNAIVPEDEFGSQLTELRFNRPHNPQEMEAYELALTDAITNGAALFAREDYVEEAERMADVVPGSGTPVNQYETQTWGPAMDGITPPAGWQNLLISGPSSSS